MKKFTLLSIIVGGFLAAALWLMPARSYAGELPPLPTPKEVVEFCKVAVGEFGQFLDLDPNCFGKCVSVLRVCLDQNGRVVETALCDKKIQQALACANLESPPY